MQVIGFSAQRCRDALQSYLDEVAELLELVQEPNSMSAEQVARAQLLLKNLKDCLKRDMTLRNNSEGSRRMTEVETRHFAPAIYQAYADFRVRIGSRPSREWLSALYDMQITLEHALEGLKKVP